MEGSAVPGLVRVTTDAVETRHRLALASDVMGRELAGGEMVRSGDTELHTDWTLAPIAPGTVLGRGTQSGITATRDRRMLSDDDADFTLFFIDRGVVPFAQNDRRIVMTGGTAALVAHGRPVQSSWNDSAFALLRIPRDAVPDADRWDRAGGMMLSRDIPAMRLLEAYVAALWPMAEGGDLPAVAARHLAELACAALDRSDGADMGADGIQAGRLAAIRQRVLAGHADPDLSMATVAAGIGLSERSGYMVMERAGESFTDLVIATRLDRADERLRDGYAGRLLDLALSVGFSDLSHFNRRFRARFGMTPSERRAQTLPVTARGDRR